jgi:hypothetical protein
MDRNKIMPHTEIEMNKCAQRFFFFILLSSCLLDVDALGYQKAKRGVQQKGITGTYKYVLNTLEVQELPNHKVRISFGGFWPNDRKRVLTRNTGSFDETVSLKGRTALVKLGEGDDPCMITLQFKPGRVIASREGSMFECGFGFNVEVDGTYVKKSERTTF